MLLCFTHTSRGCKNINDIVFLTPCNLFSQLACSQKCKTVQNASLTANLFKMAAAIDTAGGMRKAAGSLSNVKFLAINQSPALQSSCQTFAASRVRRKSVKTFTSDDDDCHLGFGPTALWYSMGSLYVQLGDSSGNASPQKSEQTPTSCIGGFCSDCAPRCCLGALTSRTRRCS